MLNHCVGREHQFDKDDETDFQLRSGRSVTNAVIVSLRERKEVVRVSVIPEYNTHINHIALW